MCFPHDVNHSSILTSQVKYQECVRVPRFHYLDNESITFDELVWSPRYSTLPGNQSPVKFTIGSHPSPSELVRMRLFPWRKWRVVAHGSVTRANPPTSWSLFRPVFSIREASKLYHLRLSWKIHTFSFGTTPPLRLASYRVFHQVSPPLPNSSEVSSRHQQHVAFCTLSEFSSVIVSSRYSFFTELFVRSIYFTRQIALTVKGISSPAKALSSLTSHYSYFSVWRSYDDT